MTSSSLLSEFRVELIGAGAVGWAVYQQLHQAGVKASFIGRGGPCLARSRIVGDDGEEQTYEVPPLRDGPVGLAIVAVKAFDLEAALRWTDALAPGTPVLPLSNGAVYELVVAAATRRADLAWRLGYCTFGMTQVAPQHYRRGSRGGEIACGALDGSGATSAAISGAATSDAATSGAAASGAAMSPEPTPFEAALCAGAPAFKWHRQILRMHRRKWLFNVVINTLTAARHLPQNGDLFGDLATLAAVFDEAWRLGESFWGPWPLVRSEVYATLLNLIEATAGNENSMARDVRLGLPTESSYLAGLATDTKSYPLLTSMHAAIVRQAP